MTFAMMALTELEKDDWSMEIDAEPVHFGQDGLGDFDWSNGKSYKKGNPEEDLKDYAIIDRWNALEHNVLFTDKECLILSPKFKFVDEDLVILRAPRKNDVYSLDLKNIIPSGGITCLVAKATKDEAGLCTKDWGHLVNFKILTKKGKQHMASCKKIEENDTVRSLLKLLHMDLFGPVSVESVNRKKVLAWWFLMIIHVKDIKVKTIRCDHGTEFKNHLMNEFCAKKGIKREYSIARTPQQNGVVERKNKTLIEAARTMLADSLLPIQFWAEAVNTACYVLNRVLVTKPQMIRTPNAFEKEKRRIALEKGKECVNSTFTLSTANTPSQSTGNTPTDSDDDVPKDGVFSTNSFDDENTDTEEGGAPDYNNMDPTIDVSSTPTLRIHKIHPQSQIIGKSTAGVLTRRKLKESASDQHQALLSFIYKQNRTNHKDQQTCLFACFLSQEEPKKVSQALADESWVEAMQEELLQFKLQDVWVLCDLPDGKRVIGTKWVFRNKRDERGTIIKNKARLVAQGYRQEEGCSFDEGFAKEVYVKQPPGFEDPSHPNKVYSLDLKNIIPSGGITCLVAKATEDESVLWHRRLGHVNFKNINKLVKGNLTINFRRMSISWKKTGLLAMQEYVAAASCCAQ
ncbi:retrovirus-related pol polyprotein from transposon TNT 1-94, partial [Tanacetum coccineum]